MPLPTSVKPGDLITADLLNAILAAIVALQKQDTDFDKNLAAIQEDIVEIKKQLNRLGNPTVGVRDSGGLKGLLNSLEVDQIPGLEQSDVELLSSLGITTADTILAPNFQVTAIQFHDDTMRQRVETVTNRLRAVVNG